jgi:hypothetical protein
VQQNAVYPSVQPGAGPHTAAYAVVGRRMNSSGATSSAVTASVNLDRKSRRPWSTEPPTNSVAFLVNLVISIGLQ